MGAGRPRKPTSLKKLEGTYRKDRDDEKNKIEVSLAQDRNIIFGKEIKITCPKTITSKYIRAYWKKLTSMLISLQVLSPADIPQLEQLCIILEKLIEVQNVWINTTPFDEKYETIQKLYLNLSNKFDSLGSKYYISPQARAKLTLDILNCKKTEQDIKKNDNAINNILNNRF